MRGLWLCLVFLISQKNTGQPMEQLPVFLLDQSAGLRSNDNRFCLKDSKGYLWISSMAGLHKFDGTKVTQYVSRPNDSTSLQGQNVNGYLFEDPEHNIWLSTDKAIHCYQSSKGVFQSYTYPGIPNGTYFTCGFDTHQQLWFYCDTALVSFNTRTRQFVYRGDVSVHTQRATCVYNLEEEVDYIVAYSLERGYPGFQLIDFTRGKVGESTFFLDSISEMPYAVRDIYVDGDSLIWIATRTGLISFRLPDFSLQIHHADASGKFVYFNAVEGINDSTLLTCSFGEGLFIFDKTHSRFSKRYQLNSNNQILEGHPQAIYRDPDGGIWISIPRTGLAFYHPDNILFSYFRQVLVSPHASSPINANRLIEIDAGRIWGTSSSLGGFIINEQYNIEQQFYPEHTRTWPAYNTITSEKDRKGRIWTLTNSGLCVITVAGKVHPVNTQGKIYFEAICEARNGSMILAGRDGGLFQSHDRKNGTTVLERIEGIPDTLSYLTLHSHSDGLIYATIYKSRIDVIDPEQAFRIVHTIPFNAYTTTMAQLQNGDILIGTYEGMYRLAMSDFSIDSMHWANEISSLIINSILPEDNNRIWISTNNGIYLMQMEEKQYRHFGIENGIGTLSFNPNAGVRRSNGTLWFGSNDGFTLLNPAPTYPGFNPGKIIISKVLVNDEEDAVFTDKLYGMEETLRLPFSKNTLSFEFSAISYSGINKIEFEYRLVGVEEKWVSAGNRGFARYSNLDPGTYTFEVRETQREGIVSPIQKLQVQIIAPINRRPWFITAMLFSLAAILYWFNLMHDRRKRKIQQLIFDKKLALETERLRIANDMHDDLGSGLSAISLRARLLADQVKSPELNTQVNELVGNTNRLAQQIRETIWTINSRNDTIDSLVTRLHQYALDFFEGSGIECIVELMPEQNLSPIAGITRREIYLAYKEALHNVLKHSNATTVRIRLRTDDTGRLVIDIRDNGVGFDITKEHDGVGLHSMRKRIKDIGGHFSIDSGRDGTGIIITYA